VAHFNFALLLAYLHFPFSTAIDLSHRTNGSEIDG